MNDAKSDIADTRDHGHYGTSDTVLLTNSFTLLSSHLHENHDLIRDLPVLCAAVPFGSLAPSGQSSWKSTPWLGGMVHRHRAITTAGGAGVASGIADVVRS